MQVDTLGRTGEVGSLSTRFRAQGAFRSNERVLLAMEALWWLGGASAKTLRLQTCLWVTSLKNERLHVHAGFKLSVLLQGPFPVLHRRL